MIFGVGTDICDVRRIRRSVDQFGSRFANKILHSSEMDCWHTRKNQHAERGVRYLATRFAAKEAVSKAIGLGMQSPMNWHACEITTRSSGAPSISLHGALKDWCAQRNLVLHLSLSDETDYVVAFCVAATQPF